LATFSSWADESIPSSDYVPAKGQPFFLLTDASFSSNDAAKVRLEVPGRDYAKFELQDFGGIDITLYRVPQPLEFLKKQPNLHRIELNGNYQGEGLSNTLSYLWDNWYRKSRRAWQRLFSYESRKIVTEEQPQLKMGDDIKAPSEYRPQPQFAPIKGLELIQRFRYPIWDAKTIEKPANANLQGSSSSFTETNPNNFYIPLGKLKPGLYVVEGSIANFRANALLFVTDTVAITKITSREMMVWTADRAKGTAQPNVSVLWTDGTGVLQSGKTDADGAVFFQHESPEQSYALGEDEQGGVFVSENFYYDAEIYSTQLYTFTDRPLYRPGDQVQIKSIGREFLNAHENVALKDASAQLNVLDPTGTIIFSQKLNWKGDEGLATAFSLPENAVGGGYDIRLTYGALTYNSSFRVAEYIKPHFEIHLTPKKPIFKTGEPIEAAVALTYPDGKPVANGHVQLSIRAQAISMVNGEMRYMGHFPIELSQQDYTADSDGKVAINLPAAEKPSRYIFTIFANDGAAYRVKSTQELLIERGAGQFSLESSNRLSQAGESVSFNLQAANANSDWPAEWQWIRLEDQSKKSGELGNNHFELTFEQAGHYSILLLDENGNTVGSLPHRVVGADASSETGRMEITLDQPKYQVGDTAHALIEFPHAVDEALLTLERDNVQAHARLSSSAEWVKLEKISATQWKADIEVKDAYQPNLTFSVLYVKDGDFHFENTGLQIEQPKIEIAIQADKAVYTPGETAELTLNTQLNGKPVSALLSVGVVDEMIYALQPEIAPDVLDFFYHPRRNNVKTNASLSFISYDLALAALPEPPKGARSERAVKVLERPRRDNIDTAAWWPNLKTDAQGQVKVQFKVPESLTRWRITARAIAADGLVGQKINYVRSDKPMYAVWSGPRQFRDKDEPVTSVILFNQQKDTQTANVKVSGAAELSLDVTLKPGANFIDLPIPAGAEGDVNLQIRSADKLVDALAVNLKRSPVQWRFPQQQSLSAGAGAIPLNLPADAESIRVRARTPADAWNNVFDSLLNYPYGCVEQTSSRLLPLSLAVSQTQDDAVRSRLMPILQTQRLRLVHMAGPDARFTWWGEGLAEDPFLTSYAYLADWYASQTLQISLPPEHWNSVLKVYETATDLPFLQQVLMVWMADQMKLPVKTQISGLLEQPFDANKYTDVDLSAQDSLLLNAPNNSLAHSAGDVLLTQMAKAQQVALPKDWPIRLTAAVNQLQSAKNPFAQVVLALYQNANDTSKEQLLNQFASDAPTMERALALMLLKLQWKPAGNKLSLAGSGWKSVTSNAGVNEWHWTNKNELPTSLTPSGVNGVEVLYSSGSQQAKQLP
ncbi:MAG TPA: MG2 domain-containing protein, partial [Pseudomonadales bacterium]|nr:MG2 domain-containing protein [Pseudomonadales bacterium]